MLHSLRITLEDCVALVSTALEDHAQDTGYTGVMPLHHAFSLTIRLLLHTLQRLVTKLFKKGAFRPRGILDVMPCVRGQENK